MLFFAKCHAIFDYQEIVSKNRFMPKSASTTQTTINLNFIIYETFTQNLRILTIFSDFPKRLKMPFITISPEYVSQCLDDQTNSRKLPLTIWPK